MERQGLPKSCTSKDPTLVLNNPFTESRRPSFVRKERKQKFLTKEIFLNLSNATKNTTSAIFRQQARGTIVCKREVVREHLNLWPDIFTLFVVYCSKTKGKVGDRGNKYY